MTRTGELKVDELLEMLGVEHFGGLSSAFGGFFRGQFRDLQRKVQA